MEFSYPPARRLDLTENLLGHQVSDPYRWLEEEASAERADWLAAEASLFDSQRSELAGREELAGQVRELLSVGYQGTPVWRGDRRFFSRLDPGAEHGVLYTQLGDGPVETLLDPMAIDPSGLTTLDAWQPDKEGRLLAYQLSEGGDEESLPLLQRRLATGRQGLLLHPEAAALGRACRGKPVPPAGLPAPARRARRLRRAHLRHRPGQD
jgi:prolyl oligopeptidase